MAETEMVARVAKACREAVALDRGRSVPFEEMSYIVARAAISEIVTEAAKAGLYNLGGNDPSTRFFRSMSVPSKD